MRNDLIHCRAVPSISKAALSCHSNISWSTQSNAALQFRRPSNVTWRILLLCKTGKLYDSKVHNSLIVAIFISVRNNYISSYCIIYSCVLFFNYCMHIWLLFNFFLKMDFSLELWEMHFLHSYGVWDATVLIQSCLRRSRLSTTMVMLPSPRRFVTYFCTIDSDYQRHAQLLTALKLWVIA